MKEIIKKLEERIDLDNQIMTDAVNQIMSGEVEDPMIEDFLIKLNAKGITENEISSAAQVMRSKSLSIDLGNGAHVCLLYTSPSPRDGLLSRMPSSA